MDHVYIAIVLINMLEIVLVLDNFLIILMSICTLFSRPVNNLYSDQFLIGCILLTKSLSCNVASFTRMLYILESSKYLEFMSLRWKEPYYDNFQCHKLQESYFSVQGRFYLNSNSEKSDPLFPFERLSKSSGRLSVRTTWQYRPDAHISFKLSGRLSNAPGRSSVFNKKSNFLLIHRYGKIAASIRTTGQHCLNAILNKARCGEEL